MAVRTKSQLDLLFADNLTGDISAQDGRDFIDSVSVYGQLLSSGGAQSIGNIFEKVTQFTANGTSKNTTPDFANDKIVIDHDGDYQVMFAARFEGDIGNQYEIQFHKNGSPIHLPNVELINPVSPKAYGEIVRATDSGQTFPTGGAVLEFDADGLFNFATPNAAGNEIEIERTGRYKIGLLGSALKQANQTFDVFARINGANVEQIGRFRDARDEDSDPNVSVTSGTILDLTAGDLVQIWVTPSGDNRRFRPTEGARLIVEEITAPALTGFAEFANFAIEALTAGDELEVFAKGPKVTNAFNLTGASFSVIRKLSQ